MPTECTRTLANGQKCRCMATRGFAFCRHHGAPRSARPLRDPILWNRLSCWRNSPRDYLEDPVEEVPGHMLNLLYALLEDNVSDRYAGRWLRILLKRVGDLPLTVDPKFERTPAVLPPPPLSKADAEAQRQQVIRQALALLGVQVPRPQPPGVHTQPSAPAQAAAR